MIQGTNGRAILVHVDDAGWQPKQCCAPGKVCDAALESSATIRWYSHSSKGSGTHSRAADESAVDEHFVQRLG